MDHKKRVIIFEGIASSGKTTLERMIADSLPNSVVIKESETLMPLINNRNANFALNHLLGILDRIKKSSEEVLIVDRFHFTHAFRTQSPLAAFNVVEDRLNKLFSPRVVFLSIRKDLIGTRIQESVNLRGDSWKKGKQGNIVEKKEYYINQQLELESMMKETTLPVLSIDTSSKDWELYLSEIVKKHHDE